MANLAACVEVGDFALLMGGHHIGREGQTHRFPARSTVAIAFGVTLVPHALVGSHRVCHRTVEVLAVDEQMVAVGHIIACLLGHQMALHLASVGTRHRVVWYAKGKVWLRQGIAEQRIGGGIILLVGIHEEVLRQAVGLVAG